MKYRRQAATLSDAAVALAPEAQTAAMLVLLGTTDERYEEWVASGVINPYRTNVENRVSS